MESQTIEYKEEFTEKLKKEITGFLNGEETAYMVDCKFNPNFWTNLSA